MDSASHRGTVGTRPRRLNGGPENPPAAASGEPGVPPAPEPQKAERTQALAGARVLVAGATGFIGGYVSALLSSLGADVIPLSKKRGYDLRNEAEAFQAVMVSRPDLIVDVAGPSGGLLFHILQSGTIARDALQIGMNLTHVAAVSRVRLITLGTPASYPEMTTGSHRESAFWNGYPNALVAAHGLARKAALAMMQAYRAQFGLRYVYLVPSNVYGPNDCFDPDRASVVAAMIHRFSQAQGEEAVTCWGNPEVTRSFLYAPDLAKAVALACALDLDCPDPINLPGAPEITVGKLAEMVAEETGFAGKVEWDELRKPTGARRRILDGRVAKKLLGWEPETPLAAGLKATVEWYRQNFQLSEKAGS